MTLKKEDIMEEMEKIFSNLSFFVETTLEEASTRPTVFKQDNESMMICIDNTLQAHHYTFVIYFFIFLPMCLFGLFGNTLSFIVMQWEKRSHVATFLLQALCLIDNSFLFVSAIALLPPSYSNRYTWDYYSRFVNAYNQVLVWPLVYFTQFLTVWMTVLIAGNRYIAICKPYQAYRLCTMKKVRIQLGVMILLAFIYNFTRFFEYRLEHISETDHTSGRNMTIQVEGVASAMKMSPIYQTGYEVMLYFVFVFLAPFLILTWMNICLIKELIAVRRRAKARNLPSASEEDGENNLTHVMVIIMLIFLICQSPAFLNQLLFQFFSCKHWWYFYFFHISNLLASANSCSNFVVYFAFRQQFRERLKVFCLKASSSLRHQDTVRENGCTMNTYYRPSPRGSLTNV